MNLVKIKSFIKKHWKVILVIIYVISPIDLIPDVLMPLGYTEDLLLVVTMILDYYKRKKAEEKFTFTNEDKPVDGEVEE